MDVAVSAFLDKFVANHCWDGARVGTDQIFLSKVATVQSSGQKISRSGQFWAPCGTRPKYGWWVLRGVADEPLLISVRRLKMNRKSFQKLFSPKFELALQRNHWKGSTYQVANVWFFQELSIITRVKWFRGRWGIPPFKLFKLGEKGDGNREKFQEIITGRPVGLRRCFKRPTSGFFSGHVLVIGGKPAHTSPRWLSVVKTRYFLGDRLILG